MSIQVAIDDLRSRGVIPDGAEFRTAVILGSGLGAVGRQAIDAGATVVDYSDIPEMPTPAVAGHAGRLIFGAGEHSGVVFLQGRVHYYEGHSLDQMLFATRLVHALGVKNLVVTNAAGGIRKGFQPGDLMLIDGHWTFLNVVPPTRQVPVAGMKARLWSRRLRSIASKLSTPLNVHEGVYAMMSGPNYETPAEVRMLSSLNVDAVGMSTVPEALEASRLGIEVLGISCITNVASGLSEQTLDHAEVSETAASIEGEFSRWMFSLLRELSTG